MCSWNSTGVGEIPTKLNVMTADTSLDLRNENTPFGKEKSFYLSETVTAAALTGS
jgi:hypothetical protein